MLSVVALSFVLSRVIGDSLPLREITITFFIANEGISILENAGKAGVDLPPQLLGIIGSIKPEKKEGGAL